MDWNPIESAPKDGSPILLYCEDPVERHHQVEELADNLAIGFWLEGAWRSVDCEDNGSMGSSATGWMEDWRWVKVNPTHWMPIPEAPK